MRLSAFADYGLRAMTRLAGAPDRSFTTGELAAEFEISANHLTKVVRDLARAGYVRTQRGVGGGLRLSCDPHCVTLGEIVRFLERRRALVECLQYDGGTCTLTAHCLLRSKLVAAHDAFMRELDATTLAACAYHPTPQGARHETRKRHPSSPKAARDQGNTAVRDVGNPCALRAATVITRIPRRTTGVPSMDESPTRSIGAAHRGH